MAPQVVVITGAGSGIGRQAAIAMLRAGHRVALAGRREDPLRSAAAEAGVPWAGSSDTGTGSSDTGNSGAASTGPASTGAGTGEALVVPADVRSAASVDALFATVTGAWGRVDLLFNNAGTFGVPGPLDEVTVEDWNAVIGTNLTGSFLCARAAFRIMKEQEPQGGRIINNGSVSAHVPRPFAAGYTASKHAITGLTKAISLEGRPYRIACGQIDIGNAATEMTGPVGAGAPQADGSIRPEPLMDARHVIDALLLMAGLPLEANIEFLTVMATNMPYIGRG